MKLIESGQEIRFIDVDSDRVPCSLLVKLTDRTYRMTFAYNEAADFFTVSLEISPLCATGDEIDTITYDNFGTKVRLYLFDRPGGEN